MTDTVLQQIEQALDSQGDAVAVDRLIESLRTSRDYDRLFDALLLKSRLSLNLPISRPSAWDDIPDAMQGRFEASYFAAAREVGRLLIEAGDLPRAWIYFRTIREPQPIADALAAIDPTTLDYDQAEALIGVALHEGAHRVAGVKMLLASHGTCNTITLIEQLLPSLTPQERREAAALLVRDVHASLLGSLQREVHAREGEPTPATVSNLIVGRDWLFDDGGYHVDVSHLHAVVRFARALETADAELLLARELADYGTRLAPQFRYAADPPFDEFYEAQRAYFDAVAGVDAGYAYFADRLNSESDPADRQMAAYVLCDLLVRGGRREEAAVVASQHLADLEEPSGFSFARLCIDAGRPDLLKAAADSTGDPVRYAIAILELKRRS